MKKEAINANGTVAVSSDTSTLPANAVNAMAFIDQKIADEKDRFSAYEILCDIVEKAACCDADIYETEFDEESVTVYMSAPCEIVDNGIGPYEYFGCRGVDSHIEPEVEDGVFGIALDEAYLATLGLTGQATDGSDIDYSNCHEDGDQATCNERVTLTVVDPAKFYLHLDKELARRIAAKAA